VEERWFPALADRALAFGLYFVVYWIVANGWCAIIIIPFTSSQRFAAVSFLETLQTCFGLFITNGFGAVSDTILKNIL